MAATVTIPAELLLRSRPQITEADIQGNWQTAVDLMMRRREYETRHQPRTRIVDGVRVMFNHNVRVWKAENE